MNRTRTTIIRATVFDAAIALWLPSYSLTSENHTRDVSHIWVQSLLESGASASMMANGLYVFVLAFSIRSAEPRIKRQWASALLLACLAVVGYSNLFGDMARRTQIHIGPGAFTWFFALTTAEAAGFPGRPQVHDSSNELLN